MSDRFIIINESGSPKFIDAAEYQGQAASIKKGSKLGYWFGKSVKYEGEYLNKNSSINFLNEKQHANLKKGIFGIGQSSNQDIVNAFQKHVVSLTKPNSSPQVNPTPIVSSTPESFINIPQETVMKLVGIKNTLGEPEVGNLILKSWLAPPSDPFDLYLYNVLTQFKFPRARNSNQLQLSRQYIDSHIQDNLNSKGYQNNPAELQKLHACIDGFDVGLKGLYRFPNNPEDVGGALTSLGYNALLTAFQRYNEHPNNIVFLDTTGDNYLEGKDPKDKIVFCADMPFQLSTEASVSEFVQTILRNEKSVSPVSRPKAIFIPLQFADPRKEAHQVLLVVEPSSAPALNAAKITMINTHGNSLDMYRSFENVALQGAKSVYNDPSTTAIRNEKRLWASASCSHNISDYTLALTDLVQQGQSVQKHVQEGKLQEMSIVREKIVRKEHAKLIKALVDEKIKKAEEMLANL